MSYVNDLRKLVGHTPLQLPGTGIIVWRRTINQNIEVLLQLRKENLELGLPGGALELNETFKECAMRELLEETALCCEPQHLILENVYAGPKHVTVYPNGDIVYNTIVVFSLNLKNTRSVLKDISEETESLEWYSLTTLSQMLKNSKESFFLSNIPIIEDIIKNFK